MSDKELRKQYIGYILKNLFGSEMLEEIEYKTFEEFCKDKERKWK